MTASKDSAALRNPPSPLPAPAGAALAAGAPIEERGVVI